MEVFTKKTTARSALWRREEQRSGKAFYMGFINLIKMKSGEGSSKGWQSFCWGWLRKQRKGEAEMVSEIQWEGQFRCLSIGLPRFLHRAGDLKRIDEDDRIYGFDNLLALCDGLFFPPLPLF
ncbi:hypothetical protein FRX31_003914 [Thalictrum thalictroides]|uniref:Uncharacterized protein n=1 Tax=Thalictrum thalictroides TaxID=46969 RepID=A0A7J6XC02_THATH|nr:hypothetical protein FRX31_003914 [Thalictrum thalictroides]